MKMELNTKEKLFLKSYVKEMLELFQETDMLKENDSIYLSANNLTVNQEDLILLDKKLENLWN